MDAAFLTEATGWGVAGLTGVTVLVALIARERLQAHYWIGYAIGALSFIHASFSMGGLAVGGSAALAGVLVATVGMFVSWAQAAMGGRLRELEGPRRLRLSRLHLGFAAVLVCLGVAHLILNGPLVRGLLHL